MVPDCTNGSASFVQRVITSADIVAIGGADIGQQVNAGQFSKVLAAIPEGRAHVNIHINASTGGEIRGQVKVVRPKEHGLDDD